MRPLRQYINEISNLSTLHKFIMENEDEITLKDVKVSFNGPDKLYVEVPDNFSESDINIYLDDTLLKQLPADKYNAEKFFGTNSKNIADAYFEYDSIEQTLGADQKPDIAWDTYYDSSHNKDANLIVMCINNIRYKILFDEFKILYVEEDNIKNELIELFNNANSNQINEYPFELIFDNDQLEYKI